MNASQLREFLHRSREWSRAKRGVEMAQMAAKDLLELADIDSGFFVYQRRHRVRGRSVGKPEIYAPWGVFANNQDALQRRVDRALHQMERILPVTERWMLAEDMPEDLQQEWAAFGLLEVGIWPIVSREKMIGSVVVARTKPVALTLTLDTATAIVDVCAAQLSLALDLFLATRIAEDASQRDMLTGLLNRRGLEVRLGPALKQAKATGKRLIIGLVDLDELKAINDTNGHPAGDEALQQVANIITSTVGHDDLVARFGGDEFAVLLNADDADAQSHMMRIQAAVEAESDGYSVSVGGAALGVDGDTVDACYKVADERLYACKRLSKVSP